MRWLAVCLVGLFGIGGALATTGLFGLPLPTTSQAAAPVRGFYALADNQPALTYAMPPGAARAMLRVYAPRETADVPVALRLSLDPGQDGGQRTTKTVWLDGTQAATPVTLPAKLIDTDQSLVAVGTRLLDVATGEHGGLLTVTPVAVPKAVTKRPLWLRVLVWQEDQAVWRRLAAQPQAGVAPTVARVREGLGAEPRTALSATTPTAPANALRERWFGPANVRVELALPEKSGGTVRVAARPAQSGAPLGRVTYELVAKGKTVARGSLVEGDAAMTSGQPLKRYVTYPAGVDLLRLHTEPQPVPTLVSLASWRGGASSAGFGAAPAAARHAWLRLAPSNEAVLRARQAVVWLDANTPTGAPTIKKARPGGFEVLVLKGSQPQTLYVPHPGSANRHDWTRLSDRPLELCPQAGLPAVVRLRVEPKRLGRSIDLVYDNRVVDSPTLIATALEVPLPAPKNRCAALTWRKHAATDVAMVSAAHAPRATPFTRRMVWPVRGEERAGFTVAVTQPVRVTVTAYTAAKASGLLRVWVDGAAPKRRVVAPVYTPDARTVGVTPQAETQAFVLEDPDIRLGAPIRTSVVLGCDLKPGTHEVAVQVEGPGKAWLRVTKRADDRALAECNR
jgi:hypothetical protein